MDGRTGGYRPGEKRITGIIERTAGLEAFVKTVEAGSFAAAGRLIGTTPSAVSKSVERLERRLNVRLFHRTTRALSLTGEGSVFYARVAPLLRSITEAEDLVQVEETAHGTVRMTIPSLFGKLFIANWSNSFAIEHPGIKLDITTADRYVDLVSEGFDLGIRVGDIADSALMGRLIGKSQRMLVASPKYLARRGMPTSIEDLCRHECLRYTIAGAPMLFTFSDGTKFRPEGSFTSSDANMVKLAALEGLGIIYVSRFAVADELKTRDLVQVLEHIPLPSSPVTLLHAFNKQPPARVRLLMDYAVKEFRPFL